MDDHDALRLTLAIAAAHRTCRLLAPHKPLLAWDSRDYQVRHTYDAARRPLGSYVTAGTGPELLAEMAVYGEGQANDVASNLRGSLYQQSDDAGVAATVLRDFKGNVLTASRQLLSNPTTDVDWSSPPALGAEFSTTATYDALNRVVSSTTPDASVTSPTFNERSLLAAIAVNLRGVSAPTAYVTAVSYDAKAQRQSINYGNDAVTSYTYDPDTFRLIHLVTTRPAGGSPVQDLTYTYDPVGNITRIEDAAQSTVFFSNQLVAPIADYNYDLIYRLICASGREHIGQNTNPPVTWADSARQAWPLPTDPQAMQNYTETYTYDLVGNLMTVKHTAAVGTWTRTYAYDEPNSPPASNRLTSTTIGGTRESYSYDAHGNVTSMPQLSLITWDWKDRLEATASQLVNQGTPQATYYRYDASGQRVLKATVNQGGTLANQRAYLGAYEVYRKYGPAGTVTLERETLHISDGTRRICLLDTTTIDNSTASAAAASPSTLTRYQLANQLGSAVLELDENAAIISYEEYYPYGSTSFQAGRSAAEVSLKRYRYTGKERDTENGFYYHGARYYAPWLGRWTSCDPAGPADGPNVYGYGRGNPVRLVDPTGEETTPPPPTTLPPPTGPWDVDAIRIIRWPFEAGAGPWKGGPPDIRASHRDLAKRTGYDLKTRDLGHAGKPHSQQRAGEEGSLRSERATGPGGNRSKGATVEKQATQTAKIRVKGEDPTAPAGARRTPRSLWKKEPAAAPPPAPEPAAAPPPAPEPAGGALEGATSLAEGANALLPGIALEWGRVKMQEKFDDAAKARESQVGAPTQEQIEVQHNVGYEFRGLDSSGRQIWEEKPGFILRLQEFTHFLFGSPLRPSGHEDSLYHEA